MLWTISLYNFFRLIFEYYNIDYSFTESTELADGVVISEIYMYVPAKWAVSSTTLADRLVRVGYEPSGQNVLFNNDGYVEIWAKIEDGLEQANLHRFDPVLGNNHNIFFTAETEYSAEFYGNFGFTSKHRTYYEIYNEGGNIIAWEDAVLINPTTDSARIVALIEKDGILIEEFDLGTAMGVNGMNTTVAAAAIDFFSSKNILAYAAERMSVRYVVKFKDYRNYAFGQNALEDPSSPTFNDTEITLNGYYDKEQMGNAIAIPTTADQERYPRIEYTTGYQYLKLTPEDTTSPVKRDWDGWDGAGHQSYIDKVSVQDSLAKSKQLVLPLIQDIVKRFNLGFWIDGDGKINISYFNTRYDTSSPVNISTAAGEIYSIDYNENLIDAFVYKNSVGGIKSLERKTINDTVFNYGDVVYDKIQTPKEKVEVSLQSSLATPAIYGDYEDEDIQGNLNIFQDVKVWGYGNRKQLPTDEIPIMYGFKTGYTGAFFDIRLPRVFWIAMSNREAYDDINDPFLLYTRNGLYDGSENVIRFHHPMIWEDVEHRGISVGDVDGNVDVTSNIYGNFDFIINNDYNNDIVIDAVISKAELDDLLDSGVVYIKNLSGVQSTFRTLKIEGFLFDREQSVVTLTLRHFDNDEPT